MRYFNHFANHFARVITLVLLCGIAARAQAPKYNLGRAPSAEEIKALDIDVNPEGKGLPPGSGTAKEGAKLYAQRCSKCHGADGAGHVTPGTPILVGKGSLNSMTPVKTMGNYTPFVTTLWDYINRAMPPKEGGSLSPDEVYAVLAYLLSRNDIIKESDVMDAKSLPKVRMPNRDGFEPPWPKWELIKAPAGPFGYYP